MTLNVYFQIFAEIHLLPKESKYPKACILEVNFESPDESKFKNNDHFFLF